MTLSQGSLESRIATTPIHELVNQLPSWLQDPDLQVTAATACIELIATVDTLPELQSLLACLRSHCPLHPSLTQRLAQCINECQSVAIKQSLIASLSHFCLSTDAEVEYIIACYRKEFAYHSPLLLPIVSSLADLTIPPHCQQRLHRWIRRAMTACNESDYPTLVRTLLASMPSLAVIDQIRSLSVTMTVGTVSVIIAHITETIAVNRAAIDVFIQAAQHARSLLPLDTLLLIALLSPESGLNEEAWLTLSGSVVKGSLTVGSLILVLESTSDTVLASHLMSLIALCKQLLRDTRPVLVMVARAVVPFVFYHIPTARFELCRLVLHTCAPRPDALTSITTNAALQCAYTASQLLMMLGTNYDELLSPFASQLESLLDRPESLLASVFHRLTLTIAMVGDHYKLSKDARKAITMGNTAAKKSYLILIGNIMAVPRRCQNDGLLELLLAAVNEHTANSVRALRSSTHWISQLPLMDYHRHSAPFTADVDFNLSCTVVDALRQQIDTLPLPLLAKIHSDYLTPLWQSMKIETVIDSTESLLSNYFYHPSTAVCTLFPTIRVDRGFNVGSLVQRTERLNRTSPTHSNYRWMMAVTLFDCYMAAQRRLWSNQSESVIRSLLGARYAMPVNASQLAACDRSMLTNVAWCAFIAHQFSVIILNQCHHWLRTQHPSLTQSMLPLLLCQYHSATQLLDLLLHCQREITRLKCTDPMIDHAVNGLMLPDQSLHLTLLHATLVPSPLSPSQSLLVSNYYAVFHPSAGSEAVNDNNFDSLLYVALRILQLERFVRVRSDELTLAMFDFVPAASCHRSSQEDSQQHTGTIHSVSSSSTSSAATSSLPRRMEFACLCASALNSFIEMEQDYRKHYSTAAAASRTGKAPVTTATAKIERCNASISEPMSKSSLAEMAEAQSAALALELLDVDDLVSPFERRRKRVKRTTSQPVDEPPHAPVDTVPALFDIAKHFVVADTLSLVANYCYEMLAAVIEQCIDRHRQLTNDAALALSSRSQLSPSMVELLIVSLDQSVTSKRKFNIRQASESLFNYFLGHSQVHSQASTGIAALNISKLVTEIEPSLPFHTVCRSLLTTFYPLAQLLGSAGRLELLPKLKMSAFDSAPLFTVRAPRAPKLRRQCELVTQSLRVYLIDRLERRSASVGHQSLSAECLYSPIDVKRQQDSDSFVIHLLHAWLCQSQPQSSLAFVRQHCELVLQSLYELHRSHQSLTGGDSDSGSGCGGVCQHSVLQTLTSVTYCAYHSLLLTLIPVLLCHQSAEILSINSSRQSLTQCIDNYAALLLVFLHALQLYVLGEVDEPTPAAHTIHRAAVNDEPIERRVAKARTRANDKHRSAATFQPFVIRWQSSTQLKLYRSTLTRSIGHVLSTLTLQLPEFIGRCFSYATNDSQSLIDECETSLDSLLNLCLYLVSQCRHIADIDDSDTRRKRVNPLRKSCESFQSMIEALIAPYRWTIEADVVVDYGSIGAIRHSGASVDHASAVSRSPLAALPRMEWPKINEGNIANDIAVGNSQHSPSHAVTSESSSDEDDDSDSEASGDNFHWDGDAESIDSDEDYIEMHNDDDGSDTMDAFQMVVNDDD